MFTENEVASLISLEDVQKEVSELKKEFVKKEAQFLEISDHDFLSLMLMTPSVGIALANGSVSLFEEMSLNKKARKLSKGGYFMKKDPVVVAMGHLIKHYDDWEKKFYNKLQFILGKLYDKKQLIVGHENDDKLTEEEFCLEGMKAPFIFIRAITSFFMTEEDEDIVRHRKVTRVEYEKIEEISEKLGFKDIPFFNKFLTTFDIK